MRWWDGHGHCSECQEAYKETKKIPRSCYGCSFPGLLLENTDAYRVIVMSSPTLIDGMGGVNLNNAKLVAESLGFQWDEAIMRKVIVFINLWREKQ